MRKARTYKTSLCFSILFFLALMSASCGKLYDKTARDAFLKENPNFTIVDSYTGEGWDGVGYHHFYYKKPNDDKVYKEIWCFEQQNDGTWKITQRWTPKE